MVNDPGANPIRAAWRAIFAPSAPPRLDGYLIQLRTQLACLDRGEAWSLEEWRRQLAIRAEENRQRQIAWTEGKDV